MSDSDSSSEDVPITGQRKIMPINNKAGLEHKLNEIKLKLDWIEKLDISVETPDFEKAPETEESKAENDFKREMVFYNQALACATKGLQRLKKLGVPTKRPNDFFAEMAKSDSHMLKVRQKLLQKQQEVERREKVRAIRETKKQGKKIQVEVMKKRQEEKKKMINALKKTKKGKMGVDELLEEKKERGNRNKSKKNRDYRDSKYGFGGKKRGLKRNDAESSAFMGESKFGKQGQKTPGQKSSFKVRGKKRGRSQRRRR